MLILENIEDEKTLLDFIEVEKKDPDMFKESQIQNLIIQFLDRLKIDYHPSMSGLKASFGKIKFMKSQGIKAGHSDLIIYYKSGEHEILLLELKTIKGSLSDIQREWIAKKVKEGYAVSVAYGYYDAVYKIKKYIDGEPIIYKKGDTK